MFQECAALAIFIVKTISQIWILERLGGLLLVYEVEDQISY